MGSSPGSTGSLNSRLWQHFSPRRRWQSIIVLLVAVFASFAEIVSIGALLPFLAILTAPEKILTIEAAQPIIRFLDISSPDQLVLPITIFFGVSVIFSGIMRLILLWIQTRLSSAIGADFSISIYRRTLHQPYHVHLERNSSEVIAGISSKVHSVVFDSLMPGFVLISSMMLTVCIVGALVAIDPFVSLITMSGFGVLYILIILSTKNRLLLYSKLKSSEGVNVIKALQEGLGGIRDVLIDGSQEVHCEYYRSADEPLRRAQANVQIISGSPRFIIESAGMLLIAGLAYMLSLNSDGRATIIPVLGAVAMGAQRLLPVLQQAYSGWATIRGGRTALADVLDLLDQPLPDYAYHPPAEPIAFYADIKFKELGFRYKENGRWILTDINLTITKGSRVGVIGTTGSGKSTLMDILMGLLDPTRGAMLIDGVTVDSKNRRNWQAHIAHVPQSIFLSDNTISENIAFGIPRAQIDMERVKKVAEYAQISSFIDNMPLKYETIVGERGTSISGGQRQRIGIARALYKNADVIVLDEATSALDKDTETLVMESIDNLGSQLTIFMIAHRLTTLTKCDRIIELENGLIKRIGAYKEIVLGDDSRNPLENYNNI